VNASLADHNVRPARGADHGQASCCDFDCPGSSSAQRGDRRGRLVDAGRRLSSASPPSTPARFAARVHFLKDEVFDICGALALGESRLKHLGMLNEAAYLAAVFDFVEGRLVVPLSLSTSG
jgi:hypothetical protein